MVFNFEGPPSRWMCHGGRPAAVVGDDGMPSYESDDGKLLVLDVLLAQMNGDGHVKLLSRWYGSACVLAPDGLAPLHHSPGALWGWRPKIYYRTFVGWSCMGSQQELGWRHGLGQMQAIIHGAMDEADFDMVDADHRARKILLENLTPQQQIEYHACDKFRCRGATTGNMYLIEPGNGFAIIDKHTCEIVVSYCLHPDGWIPHDDVALATKLALEDAELEEECLKNARSVFHKPDPRAPRIDQYVYDMERELL